jgi:long-chain fatty acid transport protein
MISRNNNGGVMSHKIIKLSPLVLAAVAAGFSTHAFSSGFLLVDQGASGQGVAYAGAAAVGEDASTIYFNPAAMTRLSGQQIVVAGHIIVPKYDFTDKGSTAFGGAPILDANGNPAPNSGGGETAFVPNFYWAAALDNGLHFGLGVNVPFGLSTIYDDGWIGRYHGLKSEITTINVNPAIAWKVTDSVSLGIGLSYQYIDVEITRNLDSAVFCGAAQQVNPAATCSSYTFPGLGAQDSHLGLTGDDSSIGWNVGVLFDISDKSRLGLAYRSAIKHDLEGTATYTLDSGTGSLAEAVAGTPFLSTTSLTAGAELPETFSVSFVHDYNANWALLLDWTYTGWDSISSIDIVQAGSIPGTDPSLELAFQNTNRLSIGGHYKPGNNWIFRAGYAYDEAPVRNDEQRTATVPDNDRRWLSLGFGYEPSKSWSFDVAYSHLFISDTGINNVSTGSSGATLVGTYEAAVDILSAGVNFNF